MNTSLWLSMLNKTPHSNAFMREHPVTVKENSKTAPVCNDTDRLTVHLYNNNALFKW